MRDVLSYLTDKIVQFFAWRYERLASTGALHHVYKFPAVIAVFVIALFALRCSAAQKKTESDLANNAIRLADKVCVYVECKGANDAVETGCLVEEEISPFLHEILERRSHTPADAGRD